ncbi:MAG: SDR family NAD(P)-dependent oxidoreductase [Micrococcaceae bacterium]
MLKSRVSPPPRQVVVIGAASGIGRAIVLALLARDVHVVAADNNIAAVHDLVSELSPGMSTRCTATDVDVTDVASVARLMEYAWTTLGGVDAVINSAGVMWVGSALEEPRRATEQQIRVNLVGAINVARAAVTHFLKYKDGSGRAGHLVTLASLASVLATPGEATYAATKHGLLGYLKALREEQRGSGIQVSAIMPGVVDTPLAAGTSSGAVARLSAETVAESVMEVLVRPRFAVSVPGYAQHLAAFVQLMPQRVNDAITRRMVPHQVLETDQSERADYQRRLS